MPRRPAGRPQKVPRTELPRAVPAPPAGPVRRLPKAVPQLRGLSSKLSFELSCHAPEMLAPDCSRFRSAQYRREILCEFGSRHHVLAPCRARAFRQLRLHMREKPDHAPRVAWRVRSYARLQILLTELLHGIERPLPRIQINDHERRGVCRRCFQELLARRHRLERNAGQFRRLEQFRLEKKIVYQYDCIGHDCLSSFSRAQAKPAPEQNPSLPMYHARLHNTSRVAMAPSFIDFSVTLCEPRCPLCCAFRNPPQRAQRPERKNGEIAI